MSSERPESPPLSHQQLKAIASGAVSYVMSKVFDLDTRQAFYDQEFKASVVFLAQYIMLPDKSLTSVIEIMNRKKLNEMFCSSTACESDNMFSQLVMPLLKGCTISGVPEHSKGYAAAFDYGAKFLTIVDKLHGFGAGVPTESLTRNEQVEFERAMILWMEWFVVCTCTPPKKEKIIRHIKTVAIPLMFKNELSRPNCPIFRKARMNYCFMLEELTNTPINYKDALEMYLSNEGIHQQLTLFGIHLTV